jgi:hypothetical protein
MIHIWRFGTAASQSRKQNPAALDLLVSSGELAWPGSGTRHIRVLNWMLIGRVATWRSLRGWLRLATGYGGAGS